MTGDRIAPAAWRGSSITISRNADEASYNIDDDEYNLHWKYIKRIKTTDGVLATSLFDILKMTEGYTQFRLPSYDQLVTLFEGLHHASGAIIIPPKRLILLQDKPAKNEYLLASLNCAATDHSHLHAVDKKRRIGGTDAYISCYVAGMRFSNAFATELSVEQLYLVDREALALV